MLQWFLWLNWTLFRRSHLDYTRDESNEWNSLYYVSETCSGVHYAMGRQPRGRKALRVQRDLPYGGFSFIPMLKTESGNFMRQRNTRMSLSGEGAPASYFRYSWDGVMPLLLDAHYSSWVTEAVECSVLFQAAFRSRIHLYRMWHSSLYLHLTDLSVRLEDLRDISVRVKSQILSLLFS
jgi:hypothetical protein